MEAIPWKDALSFVATTLMAQFVMIAGISLMQELHADNWDSLVKVCHRVEFI